MMMMMWPGFLVVVVLALFLWHAFGKSSEEAEHKEKRKGIPQSAHDILDERYANGEISREEYLTVLEDVEMKKQHR